MGLSLGHNNTWCSHLRRRRPGRLYWWEFYVLSRFQTGDGEVKYVREAEELIRPERNTLLVSFLDLEGFNQELATTIQEEYYRWANMVKRTFIHKLLDCNTTEADGAGTTHPSGAASSTITTPDWSRSLIASRVYPFLCRAVRNFARDHGNVPLNKEFYVAIEDLPTRHKWGTVQSSITWFWGQSVLINSL